MGLFRKPIRALDRLPSRFRPAKDGAKPVRADAFVPTPVRDVSGGVRGPGNAVTLLIVMLSAMLLTAIIVLWRGGAGGPQAANGATAAPGIRAPRSESVAALLGAARSYADQQDFPKAEAILRAAVREHDQDQELRIALGEVLVRQKKKGEAYDQYAAALEIGPRDAGLEFIAGTLASETGRLDGASEHYRAAQASAPTNAQYPLYLAQVQVKQQHFDEAKVNLLLSAKLDGQNATTWGTLAELFLRDNKLELALQNIQRARTIQPEAALWKVDEAKIRSRRGEPDKAIILLNSLDRSQQREPSTLQLMAQCYGLLKRPADAARLYSEASDADPTSGELAYQAAVWLNKSGGRDEARRYAARSAQAGHAGGRDLAARLAD